MLAALRRRLQRGPLLPYRWTRLGGAANTMLLVHLRRPALRRVARRLAAGATPDVTVVMAHRNRADYRLVNALRSITSQDFPVGRVHVLVVDYGSTAAQLAELRRITDALGVARLEVTGTGPWNKAHCLNIGLRRVKTPYVMVSDVDVILAPDYIARAVARLQADPLAIVLSACRHLPPEATPALRAAAAGREPCDPAPLRPLARTRTDHGYSTGMVVVATAFLGELRGYDERYYGYGGEDDDLVRRLERLGLRVDNLGETSYYLHQWHERHEGVRDPELQAVIAANARRLATDRSIRRNPAGWGAAALRDG